LEPSEELAYVIGVVLGDGSAINYTIRLRAKDKEFVEEFARCLATVLGRSPIKIIYEKSTECYIAEVHSKTLWELLKKPVDLERLRKYIEHCEKCMAAFLRGFFDSEGHVNERGYVVIDNTDYALLEYVQQLLKKIGIESTGPHLVYTKGKPIPCSKTGKQYRTKKDGYRLYIRACSLLKFYFCVGFTIKRKRRRLEEYLRRTRKI
jgi:intein-encoded DNA endonuclease-like protein